MRLIECVPNFSEGRDMSVITAIAKVVSDTDGVSLLNVDPGAAANRTVITFAGTPEGVCEAAFRAAEKAAQLIDMSKQHGTHPRIGATDVLPLVPISGVTLEECAEMARNLAKRMADELAIPCYCYESAAFRPEFSNLAVCRIGEYEGIAERIMDKAKGPDLGARPYDEGVAHTGCSVVGARNFLIAVNFNLNSTSVPIAKEIAYEVREKGHNGKKGTLKGVKAIGWYIDEYGIAQVSMNITDIYATALHEAYLEVCRVAKTHGVEVTGTEIIGLVPKECLVKAGTYFLNDSTNMLNPSDMAESSGWSESEIIDAAISGMHLDDLCPFDPDKKVIEYVINKNKK